MADVKKLELNLESIDWENTGSYIDTTNEGILIRDNERSYEILAIKKIEQEKDKNKYLEICEQVALDYCIKLIGKDKLSLYSKLYEREIFIKPSPVSFTVKSLVIGKAYYRPSHFEYRLKSFEDDIWLCPFGYKCFKLWKKNDPAYIYKLREYSRKLLKEIGYKDIRYKDSDIRKGLFSNTLGDIPEDVFMTKLTEVLSSGFVHIRNLNDVSHKTKNYIEYHHPDNQYSKNDMTYEEESQNNNSSSEKSFTEKYHKTISKALSSKHRDVEDLILDLMTIRQIEDVAKNVLTKKEYQVLQLYLDGLTITEIARKTGVTRQSVSEMKKRAENKLREYLS